jgi:outer membrane lipoprotein-sorting protein
MPGMMKSVELDRRALFRRVGWRRLWLIALCALLAVPLATPAASEWSVDELMRQLAKHPGGRATFVERKYLAVLDRPVESSGELSFIPPARMEKRTLKPKAELLVLDGDSLTVERGKQKYTLSLAQYPEVAAFVDSIRGTLAGDLRALQNQYRVELDGEVARWTLTLLPTDTKMAAVVLRIRVSGSQDEVRSIEILQADGDRSVMTITKVVSR